MYFFCQCLIYVLNHELSTIVNNVFMLLLRLIKKKSILCYYGKLIWYIDTCKSSRWIKKGPKLYVVGHVIR